MRSENQIEFENVRRNFIVLIVDGASYFTAISFSNVSLMSVFMVKATGSTFVAGLLDMLRIAGFFIPQILSMNVGAKAYKRDLMIKWTFFSRISLILAVLGAFLMPNTQHVALAFLVSLTLFSVCDGFSVVPWLEMVAKSIPPTKRGSCFGFIQFIGGLGTVAVGFLISKILSDPNLVFPKNYGLLLLSEFIIMVVSVPFLVLMKEKPDVVSKDSKSILTLVREISRLIQTDKTVRSLAFIQLLISGYSVAMPFYSIYLLARLGGGEELLGFFLSFQMVGRLIWSFLWARLSNKGRNKQILQYTSLMFVATPLLALVIGILPLPRALLEWSTLFLFFLLGAAVSSVFLAFNNYVMGIAHRRQRPFLLGFLNSLTAVTSILPLLGGVIVGYLPYEYVFLTSLVPVGLGFLLTYNLKQA